jgi:hypothetical protein
VPKLENKDGLGVSRLTSGGIVPAKRSPSKP